MRSTEIMLPILMPALAPGLRLALSLVLWEGVECAMNGVDDVVEAEIEDWREVGVVITLEEADEDEDTEAGDDEGRDVAATRTDAGTEPNACICCTEVGSGLPPAAPNSLRPHVFGSTPSLDVISKTGVLAKSSPAKSSI